LLTVSADGILHPQQLGIIGLPFSPTTISCGIPAISQDIKTHEHTLTVEEKLISGHNPSAIGQD